MVKRIALPAAPDAAIYDPVSRRFYVASGSSISVISVASLKQVGIFNAGFANIGSLAIDSGSNRLYTNQLGTGRIAVISRLSGAVETEWNSPGVAFNAPMSLDVDRHRLFVASRTPGKLLIVDTQTGKLLQSLDSLETADDMAFDPGHYRIYVTGEHGVNIFVQQEAGRYIPEARFGTMKGKSSVYVPSLQRLYIIHAQSEEDGAGLQVYQGNR